MAAQVFHLRSPLHWSRDWSQQELAEFYRVESALIQAGFQLETDRGVTDEGDPWFTFCRREDGEVFIHFARIDGQYLIDGGPLEGVARGPSFSVLVREIIEKQPLLQARQQRANNVFMHPAALLIALVGGAFFHSPDAKAAVVPGAHGHGPTHHEHRRQIILITESMSASSQNVALDSTQAAAVMAGVMIGLDRRMDLAAAAFAPDHAFAFAPLPQPLQSAPAQMDTFNSPVLSDSEVHRSVHAVGAPILSVSMAETAAPIHLDLAAAGDAGFAWSLPVLPPPVSLSHAVALPAPAPIVGLLVVTGDAAQVIQLAESANGPSIILQQVDHLPDAVAQVIGHGDSGKADAPPAGDVAVHTPPADTPSQTDTGANPPVVNPQNPTPPTPPAPSTPVAQPGLDPHDPALVSAVAAFMNAVQGQGHGMGEYVQGGAFVLYDTAIMHTLPQGTVLTDAVYNLSDGTQISLVGTQAEIHAAQLWLS